MSSPYIKPNAPEGFCNGEPYKGREGDWLCWENINNRQIKTENPKTKEYQPRPLAT